MNEVAGRQPVDCPGFRQDELLYESDDGLVRMACPSIGIVYAPPFDVAALSELLWPDEWSILPPG